MNCRSGDTKSPLLADLNLMNGYVFKGSVLAADLVAGDLKSTLARVGVQRSAAFFEEDPARQFKERFIFHVYRFLMEKVLTDPQFGVLIKPKKDSTVELPETEIGPLFDRARRTGWFIVLSWHCYPGIVARAVDLSTGMLGTSTLEAAVIGRRTLHLNLHLNSRDAPHPFFASAENNIFETVEEFTAAIETFFREETSSDIGRYSDDFLQSAGHYGDGCAGERMAHIALEYVGQLESGSTPRPAFERTMAGFDSRWGICELRPSRPAENAQRWRSRRRIRGSRACTPDSNSKCQHSHESGRGSPTGSFLRSCTFRLPRSPGFAPCSTAGSCGRRDMDARLEMR